MTIGHKFAPGVVLGPCSKQERILEEEDREGHDT